MSATFTSPSRSATLSIPAASFITGTPTPASATSKRLLDPSEQLVKRWQRIGSEIASSRRMSWSTVIALNRQLDIVENLLQSLEPLDEFWRRQEDYTAIGILNNRVRYFEPTVSMVGGNLPSLRDHGPQEMTGSVAKRPISLDDGTMAKHLSNAVSQLQRRQYEFKQLHDMAILKIERQGEIIFQLKSKLDQLEKDTIDDEEEFTYLKLQLRMLEAQTLPYVSEIEEDDLSAGIQRWKLDWAEVENRHRKRRHNYRESWKQKAWSPMLPLETAKGENDAQLSDDKAD